MLWLQIIDNGEEGMITLDTLRHERKAEILRLAGMRGCRNVRVFGSVALGENRPDSDVDFLVDMVGELVVGIVAACTHARWQT